MVCRGTRLEIVKMALIYCGEPAIASLQDPKESVGTALAMLDGAITTCLTYNFFTETVKKTPLNEVEDMPGFYQLPGDFLLVRKVTPDLDSPDYKPGVNLEIEAEVYGSLLKCNTKPILEYVACREESFTQMFVNFCSITLAKLIYSAVATRNVNFAALQDNYMKIESSVTRWYAENSMDKKYSDHKPISSNGGNISHY